MSSAIKSLLLSVLGSHVDGGVVHRREVDRQLSFDFCLAVNDQVRQLLRRDVDERF